MSSNTSARNTKTRAPIRQGRPAVKQEPAKMTEQSQSLLTTLVEQISALKDAVEQLRNETSVNQAETQRLREAVDRQVHTDMEVNRRSVVGESPLTTETSFTPRSPATDVVAVNRRKIYDLPQFSGRPEDWPLFLANFNETTATFQYTNTENTFRLQKCLEGEAREAVLSLLIHPNNVSQIIDILTFRFGRPDLLVKAQLAKIQRFPAITDIRVEHLIPFATMVENVVAFLLSAKCQHHLANPTLLDELSAKLPLSRRYDWAAHAMKVEPYPTIQDFSTWLSQTAKIIQFMPQTNSVNATRGQPRRLMYTIETQHKTHKDVCSFCGADHQVSACTSFKSLVVKDRWRHVKSKHLCFSCLRSGHGTAICRHRERCNENGCRRFHQKLLHEAQDYPTRASELPPVKLHTCRTRDHHGHLFRILPVVLSGPRGTKKIFAMFDEGSSLTLLEDRTALELGCKGKLQSLVLQWFGEKTVSEQSRTITSSIDIGGIETGACHYSLKNIKTVKNLGLPMQSFNKWEAEHLKNVPVNSYKNARPVLLIGLDNCHLGAAVGPTVEGGRDNVIATRTKLGWIAYGPKRASEDKQPIVLHIRENKGLESLNQLVGSYFTTENFGVQNPGKTMESDKDARARDILTKTTQRVGKQFETGLLWCRDKITMPDNLQMATKRLLAIEKKMRSDQRFANRYEAQMTSYIEKGYAKELVSEDVPNCQRKWYLPHFGVTNPHKPKKLRIVFDAAAETNGISLNSMLLKGPEQANPLLSVLFKFRQGIVGVTADIEEMFSQIKIRAEDTNFQRFLWRGSTHDQPIKTYIMTSMIFGAACSPCAAEYIKNLNAKSFQHQLPEAVDAIVNNHYVDDYVCSFPSQEEAKRISLDVKRIHSEGGFTLRRFVSNVKAVQDKLNSPFCNTQSSVSLEVDKDIEKVLGMFWKTEDDTYRFRLKFSRIAKEVLELARPPTKREMLGIIMAVFDPYGFIANFLIYSKLLLQNTWEAAIDWDDPLPDNLFCRWKVWLGELQNVSKFKINRCYSPHLLAAEKVELHVFTDASERAFAAVGYFRIIRRDQVDVAFVCAKTRCAPRKLLSVPRLELQAAVLGSRLQSSIKVAHGIVISRTFYWSDSTTTLSWIRSKERRFKPFVAHRVAEILESSNSSDWFWIPTELNVADEATRTKTTPTFNADCRWLTGPKFLRLPEHQWPKNNTRQDLGTLEEEIRPRVLHTSQASSPLINFTKFSSFVKVRRVMAWVLKYIDALHHARSTAVLRRGVGSGDRRVAKGRSMPIDELTTKQVQSAENALCRLAQKEDFQHEFLSIRNGTGVSKSSQLYDLTPFLDQYDLLRLGGRINAALCLPASARHPVILPQKHHLTQLIVRHFHERLHHQNDGLTINEVRLRYWVPHLRSVLRGVKRNCQRCRLARAKPAIPLMGQLPEDRVTPFVRPFTYTGLDYFGPLQVSIGRRREKRWVALFTCLTIRAIHLELAADLSIDAFILCLRNFVNRRGVPVRIRSDNATNFIGAQRVLTANLGLFDNNQVQNEMTSRGIEWKFSCPSNPSEGGVWERLVQSVKRVLAITVHQDAPRVETLHSLLIEAENIINSRPLTYLPVSSEEDEPLTPNHFLLGCANSTQTPNLEALPICSRKQWSVAQQLKDRFWKRWMQEYLPILTKRSKWFKHVPPLKVGALVVICDASLSRSKWQRGRVAKVYTANDGQVRSAEVKTSQGILRRPASKLAVLEVDGESLRGFTEGGMSRQDGATNVKGEMHA